MVSWHHFIEQFMQNNFTRPMLKTTLVIDKMLYLVKILTGFAEKQKLVP